MRLFEFLELAIGALMPTADESLRTCLLRVERVSVIRLDFPSLFTARPAVELAMGCGIVAQRSPFPILNHLTVFHHTYMFDMANSMRKADPLHIPTPFEVLTTNNTWRLGELIV